MAKLVFKKKDGMGESVAIDKPRMSIGRRSDNDVWLMDEAVSGLHARLEFREGMFSIEDQISTNGTFVNGQRVTRKTLADGDVISLGGHELLFVAETEHEWPTSTTQLTQTVSSSGEHTQFVPLSQIQEQYRISSGQKPPGFVARLLRMLGLRKNA